MLGVEIGGPNRPTPRKELMLISELLATSSWHQEDIITMLCRRSALLNTIKRTTRASLPTFTLKYNAGPSRMKSNFVLNAIDALWSRCHWARLWQPKSQCWPRTLSLFFNLNCELRCYWFFQQDSTFGPLFRWSCNTCGASVPVQLCETVYFLNRMPIGYQLLDPQIECVQVFSSERYWRMHWS